MPIVCPVMALICGWSQPAIARRVTAVPRMSLNVSPSIPARSTSFRQDAENPAGVHGRPAWFVRATGDRRGAAYRTAFRSAVTGMDTRAPVFGCWSRIRAPS